MSRDPLDMTGLWHGTYGYPAYAGPTTPFVAHIVEQSGSLVGTILEPNVLKLPGGGEEMEALVAGMRGGHQVDFTKTYEGNGADNSIDYVGRLSGDGCRVTGVWSYDAWDGTFEMWRDESIEEAAEREVPEELVVPLTRG